MANLFLGIVSGIIIFMIGIAFMNFVTPEVTNARAETALDCGNSSISDGAKLTCLIVDASAPYFILALLGVVGGIFVGRYLS